MNDVYVFKTSPSTLENTIKKVLETPDFQKLDPDETTYIKINANYDRIWPGCNTSQWFLNSLFKQLRKKSFNNIIAIEGDLKLQPAVRTIKATGVKKLLEKYEIPFLAIENQPRIDEIPEILQNAQLLSTPVLHTHTFAVISVATKNLYGLLPVYREKYHYILSEKLIELSEKIKVFSIVDGTVGLHGGSMRMGTPIKTDLIIAGWNTLNIDVTAAEIMGFTIDEIPYLKLAKEKNLLDNFNINGDYSLNTLPRYEFVFVESSLSKLDLWLRRHFKSLFKHDNFLDRSLNQMRRNYTARVYHKKVNDVMQGDWREYQEVLYEDPNYPGH